MLRSFEEDDGIEYKTLVALSWAMKGKDRDDWEEILQFEIGNHESGTGLVVMDLIVLGILAEHIVEEGTLEADILTPDVFVNHGIDPDEGRQRMMELNSQGIYLEALRLERARRLISAVKKAGLEATNLADVVKAVAAQVASQDDL